MLKFNTRPLLFAAGAGILGLASLPGKSLAATGTEADALKEQVRAMSSRIEELSKQIDTLSKQQKTSAAAPAVPAQGAPAPMRKETSSEPQFDAFIKRFYGTLDVSFDDTSKGMQGLVAYPYALVDPANPNSGFVRAGGAKSGPVGRVGWMPAFSTNNSKIGYRGSHAINGGDLSLVYQLEANLALTSAPGLNTSYTQQSNVVKAGVGYGDSFMGLAGKHWGAIKAGTTYAPYRKSTDRLNPFAGMLGDYAVVMGNTGGDNRVEFATRLEHSMWYESPKLDDVFSFDVLVSPGQNRTYDNVIQSAGSPDCTGGNEPGSGNLPLNCDDGGFGDAFSGDLKFENGGFYATVAYEWHKDVNRNSDGIGSNSPLYGWLSTVYPNEVITATNNPQGLPGSALGAYVHDIGNEWAAKGGLQYRFDFGLTVSGIYERLKREVPALLEWQNERSRNGYWFALSQSLGFGSTLSIGWAHAGSTPGDPGGQHNYNPLAPKNTADMYTVAYKLQLDKSLYWYVDAAETINHGNAHYDLGAGGRGLTTDCHDGTNTVFVDYSGTGPTTWGGCRVRGVSTGLDFKF
jgi:predicted porin